MLFQQPLVKVSSIFLTFPLALFFDLIKVGIGNILVNVLHVSSIAHFKSSIGVLDESGGWLPDFSGVGDI